jgi:3'(2'), 5'-bisphosphate nucleotidase
MPKPTLDLPALLEQVAVLARAAGEAIVAIRRDALDVEAKGDGSPVTRADRAAEDVLVPGLRALTPDITVVSEEGDVEGAVRAAGETYWLVDPLDGTKEFVKGLPEYTVNVALVEDGVPVLGVVLVPPTQRLYLAARGVGARLVDAGATTSLSAGRVDHPRNAVVSRSHRGADTEAFLERLGVTEMIPSGSSLKMCAVAEGTADVYPRFGPTMYWDTAAGAAVAFLAGCSVVDLQGRPLRYDLREGIRQSGFLVCAPGGALQACLQALPRG